MLGISYFGINVGHGENGMVNAKSGIVAVNGTRIYYEAQGLGPPVLFISGATGDAGHFTKVADVLSDEFTVVTYDRRGNSRSPRPVGWGSTSMEEQADDAAGLVKTLGLAPSVVFGTSGGGDVLLSLLVRHPEVLRGAILHEPALISALPNPQEVMGPMQSMLEEAMSKGGPRLAMEKFIRTVAGDALYENNLGTALQERMLGNGEVLFSVEMKEFASYKPDLQGISRAGVPAIVAAGKETAARPEIAWLPETSKWLARQLGTEVQWFPGAHGGYFDRPKEFAEALRPLLQKLSKTQYVYAR